MKVAINFWCPNGVCKELIFDSTLCYTKLSMFIVQFLLTQLTRHSVVLHWIPGTCLG